MILWWKYVRVAEYEFLAELIAHVGNVEILCFRTNLGIEADVEQNIAQFLADIFFVALHQGIAEFVSFFNRVGTQALVGLLAIPRTLNAELVEHVE